MLLGRKWLLLAISEYEIEKDCHGGFASVYVWLCQGRIEPPKAAREHATYIDGKMLSVTK